MNWETKAALIKLMSRLKLLLIVTKFRVS